MVNSIPSLMTIAECDHQLALAETALVAIKFARSKVDEKNRLALIAGPDFERTLQETEEQIAFYEEQLPGMTEGPGKEVVKNRLTELRFTLTKLQKKEGNYGVDSLFEQQGEFIALGGKIDAFQTFIDALNARKAEL